MKTFGSKTKKPTFPGLGRMAMLALVALCLVLEARAADMQNIPAHITYRIEEGVYVDIGSEKGLRQGVTGRLVLDDGRALSFEVLQAASQTALLRIDGPLPENTDLQENPRVELVFHPLDEIVSGQPKNGGTSATNGVAKSEPFIPLLAPNKQAPEITQSENIVHGSIGINQSMQTGTDNQDRMVTRLNTSGNIDRLFGSGWSFNWSANARYRTGDGYVDHAEYETIQPLVYNAMLQHPLAGNGFVRLGRFLPFELPGIGYIDGGQVEIDTGGLWRFGVVGGLKPDRINLELTADEPTIVGYATLEAGTSGKSYYSGTAGVLASMYRGETDRLAILFDQRASLGSRFDLFSTAEADLGVANTTNSSAQLSRFDLSTSYRVNHNHTLRAGADHWQRTDTHAERAHLALVNDSLFDSGYWRYWVGGRHRLPLGLRLNEEIAYTVSDATDNAMRWRVGLSRTGILGWSSANIAATAYNLEAQGSSGYGGLLSAYLPLWDGRFSLRPSTSMRWLDPDNGGDGFSVSYYSLYLDARLNKSWLLSGGFTQTLGDSADSTLFDLGLRYRW